MDLGPTRRELRIRGDSVATRDFSVTQRREVLPQMWKRPSTDFPFAVVRLPRHATLLRTAWEWGEGSMDCRRTGLVGRAFLATLSAGLVVAGCIVAVATQAAASINPPWRFTTVSTLVSLNFAGGSGQDLQCPAGYRPIWGGVTADSTYPGSSWVTRRAEWVDPPSRSYHHHLVNFDQGGFSHTVRVTANCVWADQLGPIVLATNDFAVNSSTNRGGGTVSCPAGYRVLNGGADWNTAFSGRGISFNAPVLTDGVGTGWYATGYGGSGNSLHVEAYCVEESYLSTSYATVDISGGAASDFANVAATAQCGAGYRVLTGGAYPWGSTFPTQDRGHAWVSGPSDAQTWKGKASLRTGDQLRTVAICIPASTPSISFTQTPDQVSSSRTASFAWTSTDQAGENLTVQCQLDGMNSSCPATGSKEFTNLDDGGHDFWIRVTNETGRSDEVVYSWTVEATAPTVTDHTPAAELGLTSPVTMTFSEPVEGVSGESVQVQAQAADVNVPGTVTHPTPTTAVWSPKTTLVPGETYRVSLTSAVHDTYGNALAPTQIDVRATTTVQNTSPALTETWDLDNSSVASNDKYVTSQTRRSSISKTFTAKNGQVISVSGIRLPGGGFADILLDGVKQATKSFYAKTVSRAKVYASAPLSGGTHTLSVRPTGTKQKASNGRWVSVDNFTLGTTRYQESALRQAFRRVSSASASGGSYDEVTHKRDNSGAPAFKARFVGSGLKVFATKTASSGKFRVFVDGVLKKTVDLRASSPSYGALVYSASLAAGSHTVRLTLVGTSSGAGSAVGIDYLTTT
jgi:hypothetical protein